MVSGIIGTLIPIIVTIVSLSVAIHMFMITVAEYNDHWYDIINTYYTFDESHTDMIDSLIDQVNINKVVDMHHKVIPDIGSYSFSFTGRTSTFSEISLHKVALQKTVIKKDNKNIIVYVAKSFYNDDLIAFNNFLKMKKDNNAVSVISIDTAGETPKTVKLTKICKMPNPNQESALHIIKKQFTTNEDHNIKIVLMGVRGIGKTYLGCLLKKNLEKDDLNLSVLLYDDFNPSSIGANINTIALKHAKPNTPVIIMINEIDTFFDEVLHPTESFDPRLKHTRNRSEFHNMLDAIGSIPNIIAIYTTEKTDIHTVEEYRSFVRKGRVDMFIRMEKNSSINVSRLEDIIDL